MLHRRQFSDVTQSSRSQISNGLPTLVAGTKSKRGMALMPRRDQMVWGQYSNPYANLMKLAIFLDMTKHAEHFRAKRPYALRIGQAAHPTLGEALRWP